MTIRPMSNVERLTFVVNDLHPKMRGPIIRMRDAALALQFKVRGAHAEFHPFEGFRTPERQNYLLTVEKTTKAGPWESAHQYGLAVDFAVIVKKQDGSVGWSWPNDAPWQRLKDIATSVGLDIPISWDRGHVQHPLWNSFKPLLR